jgi:hypothetical protein
MSPRYRNTVARFAGGGNFTPNITLKVWRAADFNGLGLPTGFIYETRTINGNFAGAGRLESALNDGLSGIIQIGYAANFSGGGAFYPSVVGGKQYPDGLSAEAWELYLKIAQFGGEGDFIAYIGQIQIALAGLIGSGALSANVMMVGGLMANLAGSGALSANAYSIYTLLAQYLGTGQLSAPWFAKYLTSMGISGAGALTALIAQSYQQPAATGGSGTVSALIMQRYLLQPPFSGSGTLSATVMARPFINAILSGDGNLSSAISKGASQAANFQGTGLFAASAFEKYFIPSEISDDFNRANSITSAGPNWTNRYQTVGVSGNAAYAAVADWCLASHNTLMNSDDMEASIVLGTTINQDYIMVGIGMNTAGEGAFLFHDGAGNYQIFNQRTWAINWTFQAGAAGPLNAPGNIVTIRRVGNTYIGLVNGTPIPGLAWIDSSNLVPRDANHRMVDIGLYPNSRSVDAFMAASLGSMLSGDGVLTTPNFARYQTPVPAGGDGTMAVTVSQRYNLKLGYNDDYVRANSASDPGNGWLTRSGLVGITGNAIYPSGSGWCEATAPVLMNSDDMEVSIVLGSGGGSGDYTAILLGFNEAGQGIFCFFNGGSGWTIYTQSDWAPTLANYGTGPFGALSVGDKLTCRRVGNVYTVFRNGQQVGSPWPDSTNMIPRDALHRQVGIAGYDPNGDGLSGRRIDQFIATDLGSLAGAGFMSAAAFASYARSSPFSGGSLLTATQAFPAKAPQTDTFTTIGAYTYTIPYWARYIDIILVGGGGGGQGMGLFGSWGEGGFAGTWDTITMERGVSIPWTTSQITGVVGAAGTAGPASSAAAGAGGASTANATGMAAQSGAGGAGGAASNTQTTGDSPGNVVVQGVTYVGGAAQGSARGAGNAPGGGGGGTTVSSTGGGVGSRGQVWFRAWQ